MTATHDPIVAARRVRLRRFSRAGSLAARAMALGIPATIFGLWLAAPEVFDGGHRTVGAAPLPFGIRTLEALLICAPALLAAWGLRQLDCLFALFADGAAFSLAAQRRLSRFAGACLALAIFSPAVGAGLSVVQSWANPPGERVLAIAIGTDTVSLVLLSALLYAVASVLAEAAALEEESRLTI